MKNAKKDYRPTTGIAATVLWIVAVVWLSSGNFDNFINEDTNKINLNEVGDFFAGLFAPIAAGWFVLAVFMQKDEMKATNIEVQKQAKSLEKQSIEMKKQNFENTFFSLVSSFNNIIEGMKYGKDITGRGALQEINEIICKKFESSAGDYNPVTGKIENEKGCLLSSQEFIKFYDDEWENGNRQCLSHYFRMMNRIIQFVDNNQYFHYRKKKEYVSFLRSHFSDDELMLFLFNTMHHYGKAMLYFVIKYDLFDNFPSKMLPKQQYVHDHIDDVLDRCEQVKRLLAKQEKKMKHKEDYTPLHDLSFLAEIDFIAHGAYVNEDEESKEN